MQTDKISMMLCATLLAFSAPCLAADDGAKIFAEACSGCHRPKMQPLDNKHMTREQWKEAIDRMIELDRLDPKPSKEKQAILLDYLVSTHGPADTAPAGAAPAAKATDAGKN